MAVSENLDRKIKISPSLMCIHSWELKNYIRAFEEKKVDSIHFDVMDGHFVDNIMLGRSMFEDVIELTEIPIDIHLMCHQPERFINFFPTRKQDKICFHPDAICNHPYRLLQTIKYKGMQAGVALSPATPVSLLKEIKSVLDYVMIMTVNPGFAGQKKVPDYLDKIYRVSKIVKSYNICSDIFVDGNTTQESAKKMQFAGANGFVVGTSSLLQGVAYFSNHWEAYVNALASLQTMQG